MEQVTIANGSRKVVAMILGSGTVLARLYVNNGETATLLNWKGKTVAGAQRWAKKVLA